MKKTLMSIQYKTKIHISWAAWYIIIYVTLMPLLYYVLIKTSVINNSTGSLSYRIWGLVIFQFAVMMRFKEDFDFFLTLSNTRKEIFYSFMGVAVIFSVFFRIFYIVIIIRYFNNITLIIL